MRAAADAVMVGAGTVRRDDPSLTAREPDGPDPVRVVVSRGGDLSPDALIARTARQTPTILLTEAIDDATAAALSARGVEIVRAGGLRDGLAALARRGLLEILFEGGPTLAGALLSDELIDRFVVFVAPLVLGRGAPDLVALPAPATVAGGLKLSDVVWTTAGPDIVCRGRVVKRKCGAAASPATVETPAPREEPDPLSGPAAQEREG
jgi:riboflavin-specific deaminase-like protein